MAVDVRLLAKADDRSAFDCGNSALNQFLKKYARQNQDSGASRTYVAVEDATVIGYVTCSPASVANDAFPAELRRRLPKYGSLPVLRLSRLGVHKQHQGKGIGKALTRWVFMLAHLQRQMTGCCGVLVDSKRESVKFYTDLGFVHVELPPEERFADKEPMFVGMDAIPQPAGGWIDGILSRLSKTFGPSKP